MLSTQILFIRNIKSRWLTREEEASFVIVNFFPGLVLVKINGPILSVISIGVVGVFSVVICDESVWKSFDDIIHEELNLAIGPVLNNLFSQQQISGFVKVMNVFVKNELSVRFIGPYQGLNNIIADIQFVFRNF